MLTNTSKFILIFILLLGSVPSSVAHPCATKNELAKETMVKDLSNKMPCHDDTVEKSRIKLCECQNCSCPDSCNNIEVNRFSILMQVFEFKQVSLVVLVKSDIPTNPPAPLLRPPIIS